MSLQMLLFLSVILSSSTGLLNSGHFAGTTPCEDIDDSAKCENVKHCKLEDGKCVDVFPQGCCGESSSNLLLMLLAAAGLLCLCLCCCAFAFAFVGDDNEGQMGQAKYTTRGFFSRTGTGTERIRGQSGRSGRAPSQYIKSLPGNIASGFKSMASTAASFVTFRGETNAEEERNMTQRADAHSKRRTRRTKSSGRLKKSGKSGKSGLSTLGLE